MKWDRRTSFAHAHCSEIVGIFCYTSLAEVESGNSIRTYALDLVLAEIWNLVHDHERQTAAKVNDLMHHEGHDTGGKHIVLHVRVPCSPSLFEDVKVDIVL